MARPTLEDLTPDLDRTCIDVLGDTISYAADGATYADIRAHGNYLDLARAFEAGQVIEQDIHCAVLMVDVPAKPSASVRIQFPKIVGLTFRPVNVGRDASGTHWEFDVERVSA